MSEESTEEIAQHYNALGDSVNFINEYIDNPPNDLSAEEIEDGIDRNKQHLLVMLARDFWTDEDLTAAVAAST